MTMPKFCNDNPIHQPLLPWSTALFLNQNTKIVPLLPSLKRVNVLAAVDACVADHAVAAVVHAAAVVVTIAVDVVVDGTGAQVRASQFCWVCKKNLSI